MKNAYEFFRRIKEKKNSWQKRNPLNAQVIMCIKATALRSVVWGLGRRWGSSWVGFLGWRKGRLNDLHLSWRGEILLSDLALYPHRKMKVIITGREPVASIYSASSLERDQFSARNWMCWKGLPWMFCTSLLLNPDSSTF